jgi:Na+/H+ antiporter NhaD/arsenite permease-like protein
MTDIKLLAVVVFLLSYLSIVFFYHKKSTVVWLAVIVILLTGILTPSQAVNSINWNVMFLFFGMMFVSEIGRAHV